MAENRTEIKQREYLIGDMSEIVGVSRDTLRFYEKKGIIKARKKENGYRYYLEEDLFRLMSILYKRKMNDSEGLVLQGCGGDLQEWVDGINDMLTESGILQNDNRFEKAYSFKNGGLTCLLFPFEDVQLDVGKLAIWRLRTREDFGSTWLSDYIVNNLEECVSEQDEDLEMEMG